MILRILGPGDAEGILDVVNDAAEAYRGVIPEGAWKEPYMDMAELAREMNDGVRIWGAEEDGAIRGVMGIQDRGDVALIRHAYVATRFRRRGVGGCLVKRIKTLAGSPILVGTWSSAVWATAFYEKHGFTLLEPALGAALLDKYWSIPAMQANASIVLADSAWIKSTAGTPESG